ncbi:MAG: GIY-YIG nuclease family protein [Gammaproteobacteria bacterium]
MAFWVYILRCADGSYYTGHTDNLEKRMGEHETGAGGRLYQGAFASRTGLVSGMRHP